MGMLPFVSSMPAKICPATGPPLVPAEPGRAPPRMTGAKTKMTATQNRVSEAGGHLHSGDQREEESVIVRRAGRQPHAAAMVHLQMRASFASTPSNTRPPPPHKSKSKSKNQKKKKKKKAPRGPPQATTTPGPVHLYCGAVAPKARQRYAGLDQLHRASVVDLCRTCHSTRLVSVSVRPRLAHRGLGPSMP